MSITSVFCFDKSTSANDQNPSEFGYAKCSVLWLRRKTRPKAFLIIVIILILLATQAETHNCMR